MQSLETLTERDFDSVWEIMEESFPRDERRSREAQRKILDVSWYHLYGYRAHGELMAFLAVWEFDTFLFVEHFAVRKSCRNGGLGAVLLTQLTAQCRRPVILEVELPTGELEARRIAFYERNGFVMNPFEYMQPAMGEDRHGHPAFGLCLIRSGLWRMNLRPCGTCCIVMSIGRNSAMDRMADRR